MVRTYLQRLDEVHSLIQLEAFDEAAFVTAVHEALRVLPHDTIEQLYAELDAPRAMLAALDSFAQKSAHIRLTHLTLPSQLHMLIKTTIGAYAGKLELLRARIGPALERMNAHPATTIDEIMSAAQLVLAQSARLREGVFAVAAELARARRLAVDRAARDRALSDAERLQWAKIAIDLEHVAANPRRIEHAAMLERVSPIVVDELPRAAEPDPNEDVGRSRFSLLEID